MLDLLLWCYSIPGIGSKVIRRLWEQFHESNSPDKPVQMALRTAGVKSSTAKESVYRREIERIKESISSHGCTVIPFWDDLYPPQMKEIPDYPAFLFTNGKENIPRSCVGIVGTRSMTEYGRSAVQALIEPLSRYEIGVVSGLAYGVDAQVHRSVSGNELTCIPIAVLPGGPCGGVPYSNRGVYEMVLRRGCAVWEFLPGTKLTRELFACRNRIIAGLSQSVVVVESDAKGGSLITAQLALDYGRDVCAVPGSVFSRSSRGTNQLLADGAHVVRDGYDVLRIFGINGAGNDVVFSQVLSGELGAAFGVSGILIEGIVERLKGAGMSIAELSFQCGLDPVSVRRILTKLELKGILRRNPAGLIILGERVS